MRFLAEQKVKGNSKKAINDECTATGSGSSNHTSKESPVDAGEPKSWYEDPALIDRISFHNTHLYVSVPSSNWLHLPYSLQPLTKHLAIRNGRCSQGVRYFLINRYMMRQTPGPELW